MIYTSIICVIPARGGSKRIKGKNIIDFHGKPMIGWTIEAAQEACIFNDIYVSTDDHKIADISSNYIVRTVMRKSCCDDHSTVSDATIATLKQLETQGKTYDIVVQLMANCPLRTAEDIKNSMNNFITTNTQFQISCFKFGWMNPHWAMTRDAKPLFPDALKTRSQDLPDLYCPTGAIWIADVKELMKAGTFYGKDYKIYPIPWEHAVDIDDYSDLDFAKAVKAMEVNKICSIN